jgi:hypothetical protein
MSTTVQPPATPARTQLHWGRIVGGAFLLELLLFVVLIPIGIVYGMPGGPSASTDYTIFFTAVPIGCFVGSYAISAWMLRKVALRRVLHGTLLGGVATLLYLAICATQPGGVAAVIAGYGPLRFWGFNALRIVGAVLGVAGRAPATGLR